MQPGSRCFQFALSFLLCMVLLSSPWAAPAADRSPRHSASDPDRVIPIAFAVSGGVSLGSYEAGLNWALLRYFTVLRDRGLKVGQPYPALASVAGASAGAINAFATALAWCIDGETARSSREFPDRIDDNLFRDIWMGVGIDDLLPPEPLQATGYHPDDGVISRAAFEPVVQRLLTLLRSPLYRRDCSVSVGLLVTRTDPLLLSIAGIEVQNQRFMIPLELRSSEDGTMQILSLAESVVGPLLGSVLHLQGTRRDSDGRSLVRPESVVNAILASSAFPVAFGRRTLEYCVGGIDNTVPDDPRCPPGHVPEAAEFIDGGLFDNIPIGTARMLAEPVETDLRTRDLWNRSGRRYSYIYVDPDNRRTRHHSGSAPASTRERSFDAGPLGSQPQTFGLRSQLGFLGEAVKTGRNYELYNVLRGGEWTNQTSVYLRELIRAIDRKHRDAAAAEKHTPQAPAAECAAAFAGLRKSTKSPSTALVRSGRMCLLAQGALLERMYLGRPASGDPPATGSIITAERNRLIDWMAAVAGAIGEDQLALSLTALPADKLGDRRILLATRFPTITGSMLGNFGAFLDRPFREYDYYAGVYDAVHGIAAFFCENTADEKRCLGTEAREVYQDLGVGALPDAALVFGLIARSEHPESIDDNGPWAWAAGGGDGTVNPNLVAIHRSLASGSTGTGAGSAETPQIDKFIRTLSVEGYDTSASSDFVKRTFRLQGRDPLTWYYPITSRVSTRLLELEADEWKSKPGGAVFSGALAVGALGVHSFVRDEERFSINQSSAPDGTWQSYLPYEIGTDVQNGGLMVSWEPALQARSLNLSLHAKITPFAPNRYGENNIWFSQLDLLVSYRRNGLFSSFGIGPALARTWQDWPDHDRYTTGASMYVGLLQDKYRITAGFRSFARDGFAGDEFYLNLGITDLPGIAYWLSKAF